MEIDYAVLDGRQDSFPHFTAGLIHQVEFGVHEHFGNRETAQLELCPHDVAVDHDLALHECMLQGHGFGQGCRDARQPAPSLSQRILSRHHHL